jgi:hypothetical protein
MTGTYALAAVPSTKIAHNLWVEAGKNECNIAGVVDLALA